MTLDSVSIVFSQIEHLIFNLNKKTAKTAVQELQNLFQVWGRDCETHFLRCILAALDFRADSRGQLKDSLQAQLIKEYLNLSISKVGFESSFCYAYDNELKQSKLSSVSLAQFLQNLRLSRIQELVLAVVLTRSSKAETRDAAVQTVKKKFSDIVHLLVDTATSKETGIYESSVDLLHYLLSNLLQRQDFGVSSDLRNSFVASLRRDFLSQRSIPLALLPLLCQSDAAGLDENDDSLIERGLPPLKLGFAMETPSIKTITGSLALQIQDIGYEFTADLERCRQHLKTLNATDISASNVAHILAMMVRTHHGLKDGVVMADTQSSWLEDKPSDAPNTWNVDYFVQALHEMYSYLNWTEVISELDQPGFVVRDRDGLLLLTKALLRGLRDTIFPVALLYRPWTNKDGQLSWIQQILRNPDILSFADYPHRPVVTEMLKALPDDNKEILTWKSLDLLEILLVLSASPGLYVTANECFRYPVQNCADLLCIGLLQLAPPVTPHRQELLVALFTIFLTNHPTGMIVLNYAWNLNTPIQQSIHVLVLHSMVEWCNKAPDDQLRLARILEVAHKLKALQALLNVQNFAFALDLACLASRRDYLKLDKWLADKIQENGEAFVQAAVQLIKRRCPGLTNGSGDPGRANQLSADIVSAILSSLQSVCSSVSPSLSSEISQLATQCRLAISRAPITVSQPLPVSSLLASAASFRSSSQGPTSAVGSGFTTTTGGSTTPTPFSRQYDSLMASANDAAQSGIGGNFGGLNIGQTLFGNSLLPQQSHSPTRGILQGGVAGSGDGAASSLLRAMPVASGWGAGFAANAVGNPMLAPGPRPLATNVQQTQQSPGQPVAETNVPDVSQTFSDEVQEEANSYFQQIYTQPPQPSMSIEQFLDILKRFRDSSVKRENEVFGCMVKNLFEEYRFFAQYPDRELGTTSLLFGGVIRDDLVRGMPVLFALRVVLEALKKEPQSKLYYFGVTALEQFKNKLKQYPRYCQSIMAQMPNFQQLPRHLIDAVTYGARGEDPPSSLVRSETPVAPASWNATRSQSQAPQFPVPATSAAAVTSTVSALTAMMGGMSGAAADVASSGSSQAAAKKQPSLVNSTPITTLEKATEKEESKVPVPSENIQEKVSFLFNNLSQANLPQKVVEMKELLGDEENLPWLAQYLVMKRVSAESNFHNLYSNFVASMNSKPLNDLILKESYRNIKILLRSDKGMANFSDRTLLKNLGHWLGMLTLGQSRPILHVDLDMKSLLLEGFYKGQQELLYVVPFVAKILESCQKSKVFKPPNPWTMAILNVLGELHHEPDLKLNLKFEIEVLCRHLNVDISSLKVGNILKDQGLYEKFMKEPQLSNPAKLEKPTLQGNMGTSPIPQAQSVLAVGHGLQQAMPGAGVISQIPDEQSMMRQPSAVTPTPPTARFSYHDIYVTSFAGLAPHVTVNASLPLFQLNPPLKHLVRQAIEHAVRELMQPVADRALKVALTATEQIVKKDFGLDPDENRMRIAAHNMARAMTAGMAMITCRDPLTLNIQGYLKQAFYSSLRGATADQQRMIEEAAQVIAEENVELAQSFIVKSAAEKSLAEIDKRLKPDFDLRSQAKAEGRTYTDNQMLKFQKERLPESIRLRIGQVSPQQTAVYEEFSRNIPGFKQTTSEDLLVPFQPQTWMGGPPMEESEMMFQRLIREIEGRLQIASGAASSIPAFVALHTIRDALAMAAQNPRDTVSAQGLVQKLVEVLLDAYTPRSGEVEWNGCLREAFLTAVKNLIQIFGATWVQKQVTKVLIDCRQGYRFNLEAVDLLIRSQLVNMVTYDLQLANSMESGLNYQAVNFAQQLVRLYFVDERGSNMLNETDLSNTIEVLSSRITNARATAEGHGSTLLDLLRAQTSDNMFSAAGSRIGGEFGGSFDLGGMSAIGHSVGQMQQQQQQQQSFTGGNVGGAIGGSAVGSVGTFGTAAPLGGSATNLSTRNFSSQLESAITQVREYAGDDPAGLHEKTEMILRDWVNMHHTPAAARDPTKAFSTIVDQMHRNGILKSDDLITRFFRLCTEMCVDLCYRALSEPTANHSVVRTRCFHTLDAYVRLIALLVKHSGDGQQYNFKVSLCSKVLSIIAGVLLQDHEVRRHEFHQLPYHRILIMLFLELTGPDMPEQANFYILQVFCNTLHVIQPRKAPGFTFAWLDIIGHRAFVGRLLVQTPNQKGWPLYAQLIQEHLMFLAPFLRNIEFQKPITMVYKGTLRILLVLLHDFPELLCDYHYALCEVVPPNCVQLRNLILSAYPRNMRLPDPFMSNLKVDQLPEINTSPRLNVGLGSMITPPSLKADLDSYLANRTPVSFLSELRSKLQVSNEPGQKYNVPLMNAVVLYVGVQAIEAIQRKEQRPNISTIAHTAHMDIFQNFAVDLDTEGRYLFFNAVANQLRYPNSHTHYFSCTLLYLFSEANFPAIQEQITRILFERLVALRPHPWGLLITFIELIKNPFYKFWTHQFVRCAPEIEKLFESVARSCMGKHGNEAS